MWDILFVVLVTTFVLVLAGWELYDFGYDRGWADRDEGKP